MNPPPSESILVRGVNWLGDAVMTTPALRRLREAKPRARLTLLAPAKLAGLWQAQDFIDEVLVIEPGDGLWQTARRLRAKKFSIGLALPNSLRSALELWLAGIPCRVGLAYPVRTLFLTNVIPVSTGAFLMRKHTSHEIRALLAAAKPPPPIPAAAHHIHQYLSLTAALGASSEPLPPRLIIGDDEAAQTAVRLGMNGGPWFGLNPGAEYGPAKRWPAQRFAAAAAALQEELPSRCVIFGGANDREVARDAAAQIAAARPGAPPPLNLAGQTTLRELMAALKTCRFLLTNDSGPMHLAAALGTPVVAIFGSTSPELTGPIFHPNAQIVRPSGIPCSPCFLRDCPIDFRCLTTIHSDQAVAAAKRIMSGGN